MDWCREYGKVVDESRFPTFSSNFLAMEEYSRENGREMVLNKYADCTEEEYRSLTEAPVAAVQSSTTAPAAAEADGPKVEVEAVVVEEEAAAAAEEERAEVEAVVEKAAVAAAVEEKAEGATIAPPPTPESEAEGERTHVVRPNCLPRGM